MIIGTFIFTGSFLLANLLKKNERRKYTYNLRVVNKLINFIIITSLISIALSLYEILNISGSIKNIIFNSTWVRIQYLNRPNKVLIGIIGNFSNMTTLVLTPLFSIAYINNLKNIRTRKLLFTVSMGRKWNKTMFKKYFLLCKKCIIL